MKKYNFLTFILLGLTFVSCNDKNNAASFSINEEKLNAQYKIGDKVSVEINNSTNESFDSIAVFLNEKRVSGSKNLVHTFTMPNIKFGYQELAVKVYKGKDIEDMLTRLEVVSNIEPKMLDYTIVNTYPHSTSSYTQGLEFHNGILYEGTGQYGESKLLKTDFRTGKSTQSSVLDAKYFGEGITIFNNKIYQLTWQEQTGFVYDLATFTKEKTFSYFKTIEGWGLTHDNQYLYQSDGSETIYKLDPNTLKEVSKINVYSLDTKVKELNELEWIDGKIWANVYQKSIVVIINPENGAVEGILNFAELEKKITRLPDTDVLNGIAYNPTTKTVFITGKKWDKMFEIKLK